MASSFKMTDPVHTGADSDTPGTFSLGQRVYLLIRCLGFPSNVKAYWAIGLVESASKDDFISTSNESISSYCFILPFLLATTRLFASLNFDNFRTRGVPSDDVNQGSGHVEVLGERRDHRVIGFTFFWYRPNQYLIRTIVELYHTRCTAVGFNAYNQLHVFNIRWIAKNKTGPMTIGTVLAAIRLGYGFDSADCVGPEMVDELDRHDVHRSIDRFERRVR